MMEVLIIKKLFRCFVKNINRLDFVIKELRPEHTVLRFKIVSYLGPELNLHPYKIFSVNKLY